MARRTTTAPGLPPVLATARFDRGVAIVCDGGDAQSGDPVEAYVGDDLLGAAVLAEHRPGDPLTAHLALTDVPMLRFPALLRIVNGRSGTEIGAGLALADATALLIAAGTPAMKAHFAGLQRTGPAFRVAVDRLGHYPRTFSLQIEGAAEVTATSTPDVAGVAHMVVFAPMVPWTLGTRYRIVETLSGSIVASLVFDEAQALNGVLWQGSRLEAEVATLREANAGLRRRLDTALDLGRATLLLDRLDLFYLLLSERIDAVVRPPAAGTTPAMPAVQWFTPAEVDGIGIFDVETDGHNEWRWFGPDATIALRHVVGPLRRVVLYFHDFGDAGDPPAVRVSTGGSAATMLPRSLEGRYALDIPLSRTLPLDGMLILHLSFDRHHTSVADPRLLSAVFSGAEVISRQAECTPS